jgi:hypothetical protein
MAAISVNRTPSMLAVQQSTPLRPDFTASSVPNQLSSLGSSHVLRQSFLIPRSRSSRSSRPGRVFVVHEHAALAFSDCLSPSSAQFAHTYLDPPSPWLLAEKARLLDMLPRKNPSDGLILTRGEQSTSSLYRSIQIQRKQRRSSVTAT